MSSLFSAPKMPSYSPEPVVVEAPPPPTPLPLAAPAPLPTPTIEALAAPTQQTDPALAAQIDPTVAAANALAMRSRGIQGTIATSLVGVPAAAGGPLGAAASSSQSEFSPNALLPKRKTLLGE